ncbi:DUF2442 domain-containing protein [Paludisphaera rhizosphaerae]|uniref:DUF2442 domain-containing protein n=1 Tax=Paludisphaera rhizosphaerae TaxID=2711216 RepID=UPI0013EA8908|nr:DUF2442 domain-containing protein [Paludisphaera rhizosphaerae]
MSSSATELRVAVASSVETTDATLAVALVDGRTIVVPLAWYPRLLNGTAEERGRWRMIDGGRGLHWPDLDEDVCVEDLLAGRPSGESQASLRKWLDRRAGGRS